MKEPSPVEVKFENHQNPRSGFDLVPLEKVYTIRGLDHSPYQLHLLNFYMIILVQEGQGTHVLDFTEYSCRAGTILTVRKDRLHRFVRGAGLRGVMLLFTDDFLVSYLDKPEVQKTIQLFNELIGVPKIELTAEQQAEVFSLVDRMKQEYLERTDEYSTSIIRSELHILISKLYRIKAANKQVICSRKYLSEFIELQQLVEQNVTRYPRVGEYAKMMGRSAKTLNTITQQIVNKTAKQFIDEILVKQIKRLLINTGHPIKEVADIAGFAEVTNFYKYFKRHTGQTPEAFRRAQA